MLKGLLNAMPEPECVKGVVINAFHSTVCLIVLDNLFAHHTLIFIALPFEAAEKSAMVTLVVTAYGGHIGFLEGILPTRRMLTDRICKEFLCAMKQYRPNGVDQCTTQAV